MRHEMTSTSLADTKAAQTGDAYLRLIDIAKSYDGKTNAVQDVNLDIQRGEFITFLGPSGSGKTTTLMMVAGFELPSQGRITLDGQDLTRAKPYARNIGMVFQNYALFPHMTVAENVGFPLRMRKVPRAEIDPRVAEMLDLVNLGDFADRRPRELSGGQQQRVALARGMVFRPDILLLDEPLGALDKSLREQMQLEIMRLHRAFGITTIYVTHDQSEAMTMSDRVAVFSEGRIEQIGPPMAIYQKPRNRFVGEFIGDSNLLTGVVDAAAPDRVSLPDGTQILLPAPAPEGPVELLIRPENIHLAMGGNSPTDPNQLEMTVTNVINYGDSTLVIGDTGTQPLRVKISGTAPPGIAEGMRITAYWPAKNAYALTQD